MDAFDQTDEYQSWSLLLLGQSQRISFSVLRMYDHSYYYYMGILDPKVHTLNYWIMKPDKVTKILKNINGTVHKTNKKYMICVNNVTAYRE